MIFPPQSTTKIQLSKKNYPRKSTSKSRKEPLLQTNITLHKPLSTKKDSAQNQAGKTQEKFSQAVGMKIKGHKVPLVQAHTTSNMFPQKLPESQLVTDLVQQSVQVQATKLVHQVQVPTEYTHKIPACSADKFQITFFSSHKMHTVGGVAFFGMDFFLKVMDNIIFKKSIVMFWKLSEMILMTMLVLTVTSQQLSPSKSSRFESRKFSAIGGTEQQISLQPDGQPFNITFETEFVGVPDIGISIYNLQIEYNPIVSIQLIAKTNTHFQFSLAGFSTIYNEVFIMYMATDEPLFGVDMPDRQTYEDISFPDPPFRTETKTHSFKQIRDEENQPISLFSQGSEAGITALVFLRGIRAISETFQNGYALNYNYFALTIRVKSHLEYEVEASITPFSSGRPRDVLIEEVEYTVIYFEPVVVQPKILTVSGFASIRQLGGTTSETNSTVELARIPVHQNYTTLSFFFGMSKVECSGGNSINLLAVERYNDNDDGQPTNLLLTFETEGNTLIQQAQYHYLEYRNLNCDQPLSNCLDVLCNGTTPSYSAQNGKCYPCHYSCQTCSTETTCDTCPATRYNPNNQTCICIDSTYFETLEQQCTSCFLHKQCRECRPDRCLNCYTEQFVFNSVNKRCECKAGSYLLVPEIKGREIAEVAKESCPACSPFCKYCTLTTQNNANYLTCEACNTTHYLLNTTSPEKQFINLASQCRPICSQNKIYNKTSSSCTKFEGDETLFDQEGRFNYEWSYKNRDNELVINLLFSQSKVKYYYWENGQGYEYVGGDAQGSGAGGGATFYYDDGQQFYDGYQGAGEQFASGTFYGGLDANSDQDGEAAASSNIIDESALKGEYYGLGEAEFFRQAYKQESPLPRYFNEYGIAFGKHKLRNESVDPSFNAVDALKRNLVFKISDDPISFTINAKSNNQFELIARPTKSYLAQTATLEVKNQALIRSGETALQSSSVSLPLDRFDLYSQNQLATAASLRDRNGSVVTILWGVCKYLLFIGFGWPVMPLMLIMQYIMGHNYIDTQLPLNLDYFLSSFEDLRNPSILFKAERDTFDTEQVVTHGNIYKSIPAYEEFDRGIDFMKNSFQFFFVPLLSFALLLLFFIIDLLVICCCAMTFPIISNYLVPRAPLHAAAYTLVQALPISFFFFGQLNDTRYAHPNAPNYIYPAFNTGIAYAAFFVSATLPVLLLARIYQQNNIDGKISKFTMNLFQNKVGKKVPEWEAHQINDPIWGGKASRPSSYGFGASVFLLPILAGFFLSFFISAYPWQFTGLLIINVLFLSFAASSDHFNSRIFKYYFVVITGLLVVYELVHAGIGSNRALSTTDQWNTGYLGIGLIYAMLLTAALFSAYLLYLTINGIYSTFEKNGHGFLASVNDEGKKEEPDQEEAAVLRNKATGRTDEKKATMMKSKLQSHIDHFSPHSEERMFTNNKDRDSHFGFNFGGNRYKQFLPFDRLDEEGRYIYVGAQNRHEYLFPPAIGKQLRGFGDLEIDSANNIYRENDGQLIGKYEDLIKGGSSSEDQIMGEIRKRGIIKKLELNGVPFEYQMLDNGKVYLKNVSTGSAKTLSNAEFESFMKPRMGEVYIYNSEEYEDHGMDEDGMYVFKKVGSPGQMIKIDKETYVLIKKSKKNNISSFLKGKKSILSSEGSDQHESMIKNREPNIMEIVKKKNIYTLNGIAYEQMGEQNGKVKLYNKDQNKTLFYTRQELEAMTIGKISSKKMIQNIKQYVIDGQTYGYLGVKDGLHYFQNLKTKKQRKLNEKQFSALLESQLLKKEKASENLLIESAVGKGFKGKSFGRNNVIIIGQGQNNAYKIKDEKGREFMIDRDMLNVNEEYYFDLEGNLCLNGEIIITKENFESDDEQEEQKPKPAEVEMVERRRSTQKVINRSDNSLPSSSNIGDIYQPNRQYNVTFLPPSYDLDRQDFQNFNPSDAIHIQKSVPGDQVQTLINSVNKKYPKVNVILTDTERSGTVYTIQQY